MKINWRLSQVEIYRSDDYAGIEIDKYHFYAGYEYKDIAGISQNDDESIDWGFVVTNNKKGKKKKVIMVLTDKELIEHNKDLYMRGDVVDYLMTGIAVFLKKKLK